MPALGLRRLSYEHVWIRMRWLGLMDCLRLELKTIHWRRGQTGSTKNVRGLTVHHRVASKSVGTTRSEPTFGLVGQS